MYLNLNRPHVLSTSIFLMLCCSIFLAALEPVAYATQTSSPEKGLTILNQVVGLDLAKYSVASKVYAEDSYMGILPQESVRYQLNSNASSIDTLYTFTNGSLHIIDVLGTKGSQFMTKSSAGVLDSAKDFLGDYQRYSGNPFYNLLRTIIANVDVNKNFTTISENVKLDVSTVGNDTTFRWTFIYGGIEAQTNV